MSQPAESLPDVVEEDVRVVEFAFTEVEVKRNGIVQVRQRKKYVCFVRSIHRDSPDALTQCKQQVLLRNWNSADICLTYLSYQRTQNRLMVGTVNREKERQLISL